MVSRSMVTTQTDIPIGAPSRRSDALARVAGLIQRGDQGDCRLLGSSTRLCHYDVEGTVLPQHIVVQNRERDGPASAIDNPKVGVGGVEWMARRAGDARRERRQEFRTVPCTRESGGLRIRQGHAADGG